MGGGWIDVSVPLRTGMVTWPDDPPFAIEREALLGAGIWCIEGLDLSRVAPGRVDLICLPIRLAGAEGAPARVFVRPRR